MSPWALLSCFAFLGVCLRSTSCSTCPANAKAFPSHIQGLRPMRHAEMFSIRYYNNYKVIRANPSLGKYKDSHPWLALRETVIPDIVLYQCGTTMPSTSSPGIGAGARFMSVPVEKAAITITPVLHYFELLSVTETIKLIDMRYISSPCTQLLETCTPGLHIAYNNDSWVPAAMNMQAVFTNAWGYGFTNTSRDVEFGSSLDTGILGRAEWIRFAAAFFNEEDQAEAIYNRVEADYEALKTRAQALAVDRTGGRPQVAWVTKSNWKQQPDGSWCNSCGGPYYRVSNAHFKRDLVEDAGGQLLSMPQNPPSNCLYDQQTDGTTLLECSGAAGLSSFQTILGSVDAIVDETSATNHDPFGADFFTNFDLSSTSSIPALQQNPPKVYRIDGLVGDAHDTAETVGTNWFEGMPPQPQRVLADMMQIIWGQSFSSPCGMTYLRPRYGAANGQTVLGHDDCPLHSGDGNHQCDAIHDFEHQVHICTPQDNNREVSRASGLAPALAFALVSACTFAFTSFLASPLPVVGASL